MAKRTEFKLDVYGHLSTITDATLIIEHGKVKIQCSHIGGSMWVREEDLEELAVEILKAIKSQKLKGDNKYPGKPKSTTVNQMAKHPSFRGEPK